MRTRPVEPSRSLDEAFERFTQEIGAWVGDATAAYRETPPSDVHDQGTYTTAWAPYARLSNDARPAAFMKELRDRIAAHFTSTGKWRHGYWRMQEAHHGTEHYELFLGALAELDPADAATARQLDDAAEHLGNWSSEVPDWYDWERGVYLSMYFGADGIKRGAAEILNVPDHLRCANIALLAHAATRKPRYLELAAAYAGRWAEALLAEPRIPVGLDARGAVFDLEGESRQAYQGFAGMAFSDDGGGLASETDRAENFLASGVVKTFLELFRHTREPKFLRAAEKLLDVLAREVADPDAGAAVADLRRYRRLMESERYDDALRQAGQGLDPGAIRELGIEPELKRPSRPSGIGKRADMPRWFENGAPRRHGPVLLAALAELNRDEALARQALDLGRTCLALAREAYPHGREHGCSARSISAVARGHGRDNHAGVVTEVYAPLAEAFGLGRAAKA
ncbi:MAG: hypothetical protein M5U26_00185 [Planctomycetota bacterium]|nr:hypothetical protein [Planctomycetota bacterium]